MSVPVHDVPVTLICGSLGAGKTTALRHLMAQAPDNERWAVLVNEFGEIGLDGTILSEGDFAVREIPGGCVCCTRGPMLQVHLVRLLREIRPDRVLIEPTGLALPGSIVDMLRRPGMREAVSLKAVITLVDPRSFRDPKRQASEAFHAQVQAADVLLASKADLASDAQLRDFAGWAEALWPPKVQVGSVSKGRLDPALLELDPVPREATHHHDHDHPHPHHEADAVTSLGWVLPPSVAFDRVHLVPVLQGLVRDETLLPAGLLRLKGVLRTTAGWLLVQGTADELAFEPIQHRRDSRIELLVPSEPAVDGDAVRACLARAEVRAGAPRSGP